MTKQLVCQKCGTVLRYEEGDTTVACGECKSRYAIEVRTRTRGGSLQAGLQRALRKALAAAPNACKACQGTGLQHAVAAERASVRAMLNDRRPPAPVPCGRCEGTGKVAKKVKRGAT